LSKNISAPFSSAAGPASAPAARQRVDLWLREPVIVLAGSAFVAISAQIALPLYFTPIPLTLQTFAVLLLGLLLSPRLAAGTLFAYLAEGALGLPVFAANPPMSGLAHLLGPTGGYLLAYPLAAALASVLWRRSRGGFTTAALSATAGSLAILGCGALWLTVLTHASALNALTLGVFPFLPGDALKIVAAATLATGFRRFRRRTV
jgi:biotin transport system substrate-specific component